MVLPWRRKRRAPVSPSAVDEVVRDAWRLLHEGYDHTWPRVGDTPGMLEMRTYLGDVLYACSCALVRESALRTRCRELEDAAAGRGEP